MNVIITIDGPAGAGKSTVAKRLAHRLGFQFLDTGAMYRAVTFAALQRGIDLANQSTVADIAADIGIEFVDDRVLVNDHDVTLAIRSEDVTRGVSEVADHPDVRQRLVQLQRRIASTGDFVCEGRDQGTVVFPMADCKIFLTASPSERAQRRCKQMRSSGSQIEFESVLQEQQRRDERDLNRPIGNLQRAEDAFDVITDGKSIDQVVDEIERIARMRISND